MTECMGWTDRHWAEWERRTAPIPLELLYQLNNALGLLCRGRHLSQHERAAWAETRAECTRLLAEETTAIETACAELESLPKGRLTEKGSNVEQVNIDPDPFAPAGPHITMFRRNLAGRVTARTYDWQPHRARRLFVAMAPYAWTLLIGNGFLTVTTGWPEIHDDGAPYDRHQDDLIERAYL